MARLVLGPPCTPGIRVTCNMHMCEGTAPKGGAVLVGRHVWGMRRLARLAIRAVVGMPACWVEVSRWAEVSLLHGLDAAEATPWKWLRLLQVWWLPAAVWH